MSARAPSIIARLYRIGGLLLCLALGGLACLYLALRQSGALLGDVIHVAEPIREATLEIETNTTGATLAVIQYLEDNDPVYRKRFRDNTLNVHRFVEKLKTMPLDKAARGTLREVERRTEELRLLGDHMMAQQDELTALQNRTLATLDGQKTVAGESSRNTALTQRLGLYLLTGLRRMIQGPGPTASSPEATSTAGILDPTSVDARKLVQLHEEQVADRATLFEKRQNLESLLDRGIQLLAAEGVSDAGQSADSMIQTVTMLVVLLAFLLAVSCFLATVAIVRRLVQPLRAMVVGANAFAQGDFTHRIPQQGDDEVSQVINTLNTMAGRLHESHAGLEDEVATRTSELDDAKRVLETTLESIDDAVVAIDAAGRVQFMNRTAERLIGRNEEQARGKVWREVLPLLDQATGLPISSLKRPGEPADPHALERNWCLRRQDGELHSVDISIGNMADSSGNTLGSVLVIRNVEHARQLQRRLAHQADHDTLTELPNRVMFGRELERYLARASRQYNEVAVFFMDLDGFKEVNDVHGHAVGDEILILVAQRLRAMTRSMDLVARLGGDEFCLAIEHATGAFPFDVTDRILETLSAPYEVHALVLSLSASVGIARFPQDGTERAALMRYADAAMYEAKKAGKNRYAFHDRQIRERAEARAATIDGLRHSLKTGGFELHYQPQVALADGTVKGVEALLRWRRDGKLIAPADFLPIAEDAGLMPEIDRWVVGTACLQLRQWEDSGLRLRLAINATGEGLRRDLVDELGRAVRRHKLEPSLIEVEITESRLLEDAPVLTAVRRLREIGVRVAIDDFGTGYSSFAALRELPVDCLKIDRSFVQAIEVQPKHAAIVSAIMGTAYVIGLDVVAEGIEDRMQANMLMSLGCQTGQGLHFSGPVPASEIPSVIERLGLSSTNNVETLPRSA